MTPEEARRLAELEAKFGPVDEPEATVAAPVAPVDEAARLVELESKFGAAPDAPAVVPPKDPVSEPTTGEKAGHVASKWGSGLLDVVDLPYYVSQAKEAVSGYLPEEVVEASGYHPINLIKSAASEYLPNYLKGEQPLTEVVPGLTQARELTEANKLSPEQLEQAPGTRAAGTAAEWFGVPGLSTIPKLVTSGTKKITTDAAKELAKREAKTAAIVSGSAAAGSEAGQYLSGETGGMFGELIGGATGLIAAIRSGKVGDLNATQRRMLEALQQQFDSPEEAIAAVQKAVDSGEVGTLMDLTGERNLANVEAFLSTTKQGAKAFPQTLEARVNQIYDEVTGTARGDVPPGTTGEKSSEAAAAAARAKENEITAATTARLDQAAAQADADTARLSAERGQAWQAVDQRKDAADAAAKQAEEARTAVDPGQRPDVYSTQAEGKYSAEMKTYDEDVVRPAYKAFDDGPNLPGETFSTVTEDYLRAMDPTQRDVLNEKYGKYVDPLRRTVIDPETGDVVRQGIREVETPRGLSLRIQEMKDAVASAEKMGFAERKLKELYESLEKTLSQPAISPEYAKARDLYKAGKDRFGQGYVSNVRRANEPETVLQNLGLTGDRGAATARLLEQAKVPGLQGDVANYVRAQAVRSTDPEKFMMEYEAVLDALPPEVRGEITQLLQSEQASEAALKQSTKASDVAEQTSKRVDADQSALTKSLEAEQAQAATEKASLLESTRGSTTAQYGKGFEEADAVVDDILNRPDGLERMQALRDDLLNADAAQGGTANMDSFRKRVSDRLTRQLFTDPTGGAQTSDGIKKFRDMRRKLEEGGILTGDEANYIDEVLQRAETNALRNEATARVGDLAEVKGSKIDLMASMLSAIFLGPLPGGYNLQLGGAVRRNFKDVLSVEPTKRNIEALVDYMNDPKAFLAGIEKLKTPEAQTKFVLTKLVGAAQAAEIMGAE